MSTVATRGERLALALLLLAAAILYFWRLSRPDVLTDESSYATRAIGMVDFDFGIEQPTPWEWVKEIPWWMHLSFHDHPPLVFLIQHFSIRLFGETPFAIRLPSALAGLAAVWLVYLIGRRLWSADVGLAPSRENGMTPRIAEESKASERNKGISQSNQSSRRRSDVMPFFSAGLASAALFAFTANHVWISRIGLQESIAIALMLAAAYCFFRGMEHPRWLMGAGLFLGLGFLAKYLALGLIPIFLIILIFRHSNILENVGMSGTDRREWIWIGAALLLFLAVASPVIIYNVQLYRNFGHFDFQFSLLFQQDVKEWQARPGQESLGDTANRIRHFGPWLIEANSPYFLALAALGVLAIFAEFFRRRRNTLPPQLVTAHCSLLTVILVFLPFLVFVGPTYRFLTILTPWFALAAGYFLVRAGAFLRSPRIVALFIALIAAGEAAYAANSVIVLRSRGSMPWTHSKLSLETRSFGYNELELFFRQELDGKRPEVGITFDFPFAQEILREAARRGEAEGLETVPWGIVYPDGINPSAQLWIFLRRITYSGWPVTTVSNFKGGAEAFWKESGIEKIYAVNVLEGEARARGIAPREIGNPSGDVAFRVYELGL